MKKRVEYKDFVIEALCRQRSDSNRFKAEYCIENHAGPHVDVTSYSLADDFPTGESAIEAAIKAARARIDAGKVGSD